MKTDRIKKWIPVTVITVLLLCGCGVSEEKIAEAQSKYRELVNAHNTVAEAYDTIKDSSLYGELSGYETKLEEYRSHNLYRMNENELNSLISSMDETLTEYRDYLVRIDGIRQEEEAAFLVPLSFTLINDTELTFTGLTLKENGDTAPVTDLLEDNRTLSPSGEIVGLSIRRDADHTPWILTLTAGKETDGDTEDETAESPASGSIYELPVTPDELENAAVLRLVYDAESDTLTAVAE